LKYYVFLQLYFYIFLTNIMNKTSIFCSVSLLSTVVVSCDEKQKTPQQPNIIFILADDLGYGDLGCYGQSIIQTPHIDRLAAEGMRFTRHYSGSTVSAPSRSSLMTGLHTGHTPVRGNKEHQPEGQYPQPGNTFTIGKMLKAEGYVTGCFGKWGLGYPGSEGAPENQGFDEFFGYNCQRFAHSYYPYYLWHNKDTVWLKGNEGNQKGEYAHDIIHREALKFIRNNKDRPFFAYLPYTIPHAELTNPDDSIFVTYKDKFPETPYQGVGTNHDRTRGGYSSTPHPKADFAAMVARLDAYVGEIITELRKLGLDKNTIVMFSSDNGPHREGGADPDFFKSYGPLRGVKRDLYEGGIRIPMIAWYPEKIKAGSVTDHISAFWDLMPTFAELTGTKAADNTDGISFVPTLFGKSKQKKHDYLYWEFHEQGGKIAVTKGNWKAIWLNVSNPEKTKVELFDLSKDIHEDNNIAQQHPKKVAELDQIMRKAHTDSQVFPFSLPIVAKQSKEKWIQLFNGKDLTGWTVKIRGFPAGENYGNTFRVENGVMKVVYEPKYYETFEERFGHIFTKETFSNYKLRVEYRFTGEQVSGGPKWAFRNSGAMLHAQSPESMHVDQDFPVSIEAQFLGGDGTNERPTGNVCSPGTDIHINGVLYPKHSALSSSKTYHGDQWVTIEMIVYADRLVHHVIDGDTVMTYSNLTQDGKGLKPEAIVPVGPLKSGHIAMQSESHPVEFRKIELLKLD